MTKAKRESSSVWFICVADHSAAHGTESVWNWKNTNDLARVWRNVLCHGKYPTVRGDLPSLASACAGGRILGGLPVIWTGKFTVGVPSPNN